MRERVECHVLRSTGELESFVPQWSALWAADERATPFQSPEWLLPWWHQFGQPNLRAVVMGRGGAALGLLPFYVYREPENGQRQMLLMGAGTTDYLDGVFAPECTVADIVAGLELLRAERGWDVMVASQLRAESKLRLALERMEGVEAFAAASCSRTPALRLAELPQKIRRNAMYYRNRALRAGAFELVMAGEVAGDGLSLEEAFAALQRLHTERWQGRGESGVLVDERVLAWHREALPMLERSGMLRLCCLRLNGEIIGVLYSVVDPLQRAERTQYFYLTAYSTAHAELRPGTLLLAMAMERAADEGVRTVDMLRGDEAYKQIWHMERFATYGFALSSCAAHGDIAA